MSHFPVRYTVMCLVCHGGVLFAGAPDVPAGTLILPQPVVEKTTGERLTLANKDHTFKVFLFKEA